jgi:predicted RNase H-like HicB family nuclease
MQPRPAEGRRTRPRYAVVIEPVLSLSKGTAGRNYSAYVPDLPGCVATGPTVEAVEREIRP